MLTRRLVGFGFGASLILGHARAQAPEAWADALGLRLADIEARCGGRLGVGVLETGTGRIAGHRGDERFPLCSTYKALAAAAVLARVDRGEDWLDRRIRFGVADVLSYSPAAKNRAGGEGMTLAELCDAAVSLSDNTAGNLILEAVGGPAGFTAFLRGVGDSVTRLDRTEPSLNEALPGDLRDTTSPFAMAASLNRLAVGTALSPGSREWFAGWLVAGKTGGARLRAGVPPGWRVGDKTGTGEQGTANDVGVLWPADRAPVIVAAFITGSSATLDTQNGALADVARAVAVALTT